MEKNLEKLQKIRPDLVVTKDILEGLLENWPEIQSIAVVVRYKDGNIVPGWSNMDASMIAFMALILQSRALELAHE